MNRYIVTWQIDIEANSPRDAAEQALRIQRDADSIATVFDVRLDGEDQTVRVDVVCIAMGSAS